ncbi:hypothetical protein HYX17_03630 [Candidatus Woesearchaeota archaeon]|nr:hypothetical protein [Candidatus Woesearchaeota archaeon]
MIEKIIKKGFRFGLKIGSLTNREAKRAARIALKGRKIKRGDLENLARNIVSDSIKEQRRLRNIIQKEAKTSINKIISSAKKRIHVKKRR